MAKLEALAATIGVYPARKACRHRPAGSANPNKHRRPLTDVQAAAITQLVLAKRAIRLARKAELAALRAAVAKDDV